MMAPGKGPSCVRVMMSWLFSRSLDSIERAPEADRLLYAGQISRGKGIHHLVKALARIPGKFKHVILTGATPDAAYDALLRDDVRGVGLAAQVTFAGLLDGPALLEEFTPANALVLPSYQESAPMVIQQAMSVGLPVVATRVGGIRWQIDHHVTGLLFEPGDVEALSMALAWLHDEPALATRLAAAGRAMAEVRYRAGSLAISMRAVYQEVIGAARAGNIAGCTT